MTGTSGNTNYYFSSSEFKKKIFLSVFGTTRELKSTCLAINLLNLYTLQVFPDCIQIG